MTSKIFAKRFTLFKDFLKSKDDIVAFIDGNRVDIDELDIPANYVEKKNQRKDKKMIALFNKLHLTFESPEGNPISENEIIETFGQDSPAKERKRARTSDSPAEAVDTRVTKHIRVDTNQMKLEPDVIDTIPGDYIDCGVLETDGVTIGAKLGMSTNGYYKITLETYSAIVHRVANGMWTLHVEPDTPERVMYLIKATLSSVRVTVRDTHRKIKPEPDLNIRVKTDDFVFDVDEDQWVTATTTPDLTATTTPLDMNDLIATTTPLDLNALIATTTPLVDDAYPVFTDDMLSSFVQLLQNQVPTQNQL